MAAHPFTWLWLLGQPREANRPTLYLNSPDPPPHLLLRSVGVLEGNYALAAVQLFSGFLGPHAWETVIPGLPRLPAAIAVPLGLDRPLSE